MDSESAKLLTQFGEAVRRSRQARGLSQEELAEQCGLHRTYVGSVERGERNIGLVNIGRLAMALGLPISELLKGIDADDGKSLRGFTG
jgi:transcriptional regulator with XRE-family HTH domain